MSNLAADAQANSRPPRVSLTMIVRDEVVERLEAMGMDPHIATGRQKHHETPVPPGQEAPASTASIKDKMRHKLRSASGQLLYAARKHIVEPVFGTNKSARGIRVFLLRGLEKVSAEWQLICLTHNLLKTWRWGVQ